MTTWIEELKALAVEWENGDTTALDDYVEGVNDERQICARRLRALIDSAPSAPDALRQALKHASKALHYELERGEHLAIMAEVEAALGRPAQTQGDAVVAGALDAVASFKNDPRLRPPLDSGRLTWLEDHITLHKNIEFLYVVDGWDLIRTYDGDPDRGFHGGSLREAIDQAMETEEGDK